MAPAELLQSLHPQRQVPPGNLQPARAQEKVEPDFKFSAEHNVSNLEINCIFIYFLQRWVYRDTPWTRHLTVRPLSEHPFQASVSSYETDCFVLNLWHFPDYLPTRYYYAVGPSEHC